MVRKFTKNIFRTSKQFIAFQYINEVSIVPHYWCSSPPPFLSPVYIRLIILEWQIFNKKRNYCIWCVFCVTLKISLRRIVIAYVIRFIYYAIEQKELLCFLKHELYLFQQGKKQIQYENHSMKVWNFVAEMCFVYINLLIKVVMLHLVECHFKWIARTL